MCMSVLPAWVYARMICAEVKRGHWIPWNWNYRWLGATLEGLGTEEQKALLTTDLLLQLSVFLFHFQFLNNHVS